MLVLLILRAYTLCMLFERTRVSISTRFLQYQIIWYLLHSTAILISSRGSADESEFPLVGRGAEDVFTLRQPAEHCSVRRIADFTCQADACRMNAPRLYTQASSSVDTLTNFG